eukprot:Skav212428  [mRNA]  locus=scaffold202:277702:285708:- [translate_table: standard]
MHIKCASSPFFVNNIIPADELGHDSEQSLQIIYVWFDALLAYLSSLSRPDDPASFETRILRGCPGNVQVIGEEIMKFHTVYWPAMLLSAGLPLPKHICTHGFLQTHGFKMGNAEPIHFVHDFGPDAVRFVFSSCLSFRVDGGFSYETFIKRVNSSLANELANLVHRILTLLRKNLKDPASPLDFVEDSAEFNDHPVRKAAEEAVSACYLEPFDIRKDVATALGIARVANLRMNEVEPWAKLEKNTNQKDKKLALRELLVMAEGTSCRFAKAEDCFGWLEGFHWMGHSFISESLPTDTNSVKASQNQGQGFAVETSLVVLVTAGGVRICAVLLSPVTPDLSSKILDEFGVEGGLHALGPAPVKNLSTAMSSFNFLDDEVSEVERANKDLAQLDRQAKKPPAQWSAARTKSTFEERLTSDEQSMVGDRAGAQGGGGGGGGGPSLPFRIRGGALLGDWVVVCLPEDQAAGIHVSGTLASSRV